MNDGGECVCCRKLATCSETSVDKALNSFVCPLFVAVPEAEYVARCDTMRKYGERAALRALILAPPQQDEEGGVSGD